MHNVTRRYLFWSGIATVALAVLHVAIAIGGARWYAAFGAPERLVEVAAAGNPRAPVTCTIVAVILLVAAAYAFSAVGLVRRLPFLRAGLGVVGAVFVARGVSFVPLALWNPESLSSVCGNCGSANEFVVATSIVALAIGIGYACGFWNKDTIRGGRPVPPRPQRETLLALVAWR